MYVNFVCFNVSSFTSITKMYAPWTQVRKGALRPHFYHCYHYYY